VVTVTVRNMGRMACEVTSWSLLTPSGTTLGFFECLLNTVRLRSHVGSRAHAVLGAPTSSVIVSMRLVTAGDNP
jgi:hypothetical protein